MLFFLLLLILKAAYSRTHRFVLFYFKIILNRKEKTIKNPSQHTCRQLHFR